MKAMLLIISLLAIFCLTASMQCKEECRSNESRFDASKSWLPLKDKTQLTFLDQTGTVSHFNLQVVDTITTSINPDCGAIYIANYVGIVGFDYMGKKYSLQ